MSPLIDFVFVFDKKGENIVFIIFDHFVDSLFRTKWEEKFIVLFFTPLLMIDKKGGERF